MMPDTACRTRKRYGHEKQYVIFGVIEKHDARHRLPDKEKIRTREAVENLHVIFGVIEKHDARHRQPDNRRGRRNSANEGGCRVVGLVAVIRLATRSPTM